MSDNLKIQDPHLRRAAYVYIRPSSATQVLVNRESTERQYQLSERAAQLGWSRAQIKVIDEDLAHTGSGVVTRHGFAQMTQEVGLGPVGILLCLEASRIVRNQAQRGELRRGLPVGLLWGEGEGEVIFHPDQAVTGAIRTVFAKFAELGSARQVWLWFRSEGLPFPQERQNGQLLWVKPTYVAVHAVLSNPVYAGAYAYGKSRCERYVDETGRVRKRVRLLPLEQWAVLIRNHPPGFIDWATFEVNQALDARLLLRQQPGVQRPRQLVPAGRRGAR